MSEKVTLTQENIIAAYRSDEIVQQLISEDLLMPFVGMVFTHQESGG